MAEEDKGQDRGIKLSFFGGFDMTNLSWLTYVMIILASYRLTHLIVFDKITEFIRKPFIKQEKTVDQNGRAVQKKSLPPHSVICCNVIGVRVSGAPY